MWFSSRDVDLTISGPKVVKPKALTEREIAEQYLSLLNERELTREEKVKAVSEMAAHLRQSPLGPTLFVFDNFETLRSPVDLFHGMRAEPAMHSYARQKMQTHRSLS